MIRVFAFTEQETKQLAEIMADCQGVVHYDALVKSFFAQIKDGLRIVANCPTPTDTTDTTDTKKKGHNTMNDTHPTKLETLTAYQDWLYSPNPDGKWRRDQERILREEANRIHAERVESGLARQQELTQAAIGMAEDHKAAAYLANALVGMMQKDRDEIRTTVLAVTHNPDANEADKDLALAEILTILEAHK